MVVEIPPAPGLVIAEMQGRARTRQQGAQAFLALRNRQRGDRFVIDPRADSTSPERRTGPVPAAIAITDVGILLRLTGGKTWRGIAPYAGVGIGLAYDVRSGRDTTRSEYRFGTKFVLNGATGVRWYPAQRLMVDADLRAQFWRLWYPVSFHTPAADGSRVVPLSQPLTDWTLHPWISLGIGWIF